MDSNGSIPQWLEESLKLESPDVKASVLEFILKHDIEIDHDFYGLFLAFGHLKVLLLQMPQEFSQFNQELDGWSNENLRTLQSLSNQAQAIERLAQSFNELGSVTLSLSAASVQLSNTSVSLQKTSDSHEKALKSLQSSSKSNQQNLNKIQNEIKALKSLLPSKNQSNQQSPSKYQSEIQKEIKALKSLLSLASNPRKKWTTILSLSCSALAVGAILFLGVNQWLMGQQISAQGERIEWLLEKGNRRDCRDGLIPADDAVCKQFSK